MQLLPIQPGKYRSDSIRLIPEEKRDEGPTISDDDNSNRVFHCGRLRPYEQSQTSALRRNFLGRTTVRVVATGLGLRDTDETTDTGVPQATTHRGQIPRFDVVERCPPKPLKQIMYCGMSEVDTVVVSKCFRRRMLYRRYHTVSLPMTI